MFTVISYDVGDDRRRDRVLQFLKGYGTHVQQSVFECHLTARQLAEVQEGLRALIDARADDVRCYLLDAAAVRRIRVLGRAKVSRAPQYFLIGD
jgi:CRISPR-associated protein Cas2